MNTKELKAERAFVLKSADSVLKKAEKEDREMNDAEQALFEDFVSQGNDLKSQIEKEESKLAAIKQREELKAEIAGLDRVEDLTANAEKAVTTKVEESWKQDPNKGFKSHKEFLTLVMKLNGKPGMVSKDARIKHLSADRFRAAAGSDEQGSYDDSVGGVFVPEGMTPEYLKTEPEPDFTGMRTRRIPMQTPVVKIPARVDKDHSSSVSGGFTVARQAEADTSSASRAKFEEVRLEANNLFGFAYATEQLLADSPQSFLSIISDGFGEEFQSHLTNERINGTGVGEYKGVLNADALITVAAETGQTASTIVLDNILKIVARAWRYGSGNGIWVASQTLIPQLGNLNLAVGTGGSPIFMMDAKDQFPAMLFGQPMIFSEYAPTLGSAGQLGYYNWREYLEGIYQPMQSAESIHVRFIQHERCFKMWTRNAAQPWWSAALTPKNGDTLSPYVTLGAVA